MCKTKNVLLLAIFCIQFFLLSCVENIPPQLNDNADPAMIGFVINQGMSDVAKEACGAFYSNAVDGTSSREVYLNSQNSNAQLSTESRKENYIPPSIRKRFENPESDCDIEFVEPEFESDSEGFQSTMNVRFGATESEIARPKEETRDFYYYKTENAISTCKATQKTEGTYCIIYYYDNVDDVKYGEKFTDPTDKDFEALADFFDSIYEPETNLLGSATIKNTQEGKFIESDEKIIIFVYDLFGDAKKESDGGTYGYFYPVDLYTAEKYSNKAQMFYVDSDFLKKFPGETYSTLVHEFNHLLNYVNKIVNNDRGTPWIVWFSEMLSMNAEDVILGKTKADKDWVGNARIPYFVRWYSEGFYNWDFTDKAFREQLIVYGNTYAFGAYLIRNFGGINLLHEMATNKFVGSGAITAALSECGFHKESFESVFEKFPLVIANVNTNEADYVSLNKNVSQTKIGNYSYSLPAINLYEFEYENNNSRIIPGPWFGKLGESYSLGPWGFVVYRSSKLVYKNPQDSKVAVYYYSQEKNELKPLWKRRQ